MADLRSAAEEVKKAIWKKSNGKYMIPDRDLDRYQKELMEAMNDKDKFILTALQLACQAHVSFQFLYDLIDDFDKNKALAYGFLNALHRP